VDKKCSFFIHLFANLFGLDTRDSVTVVILSRISRIF